MQSNGDPLFGLSQRALPSSVQAEQALLGALLANNKAHDRVAEFLAPHHFADPINGRIYEAICRRIDAGRLVDAVTLKTEFQEGGILHEVGGTAYLAQLLSAMVGIVNAGEYGRAILDSWMRRELIDFGAVVVDNAFGANPDLSAHDQIEAADALLTRISDGAGSERPAVSIGDAVAAAIEITQAASRRESAIAGITCGLAALDRMLSGLQPDKLILIGARPSMGKTGLGLCIAVRAAAAGANTLYWSGEMPASQLGARMAAAKANLSTVSVFSGRGWDYDNEIGEERPRPLSPGEWTALGRAGVSASRLPLMVDDRQAVTVQALRARARRMRRAKKLDLLVVDYVGLLRSSGSSDRGNLYERMTDISRDLTALKKELNVPVVVLAQLSRANESREDKQPVLSDLRDSGALEQDADVVAFIHRPHYYLSKMGEPVRRSNERADHFAERADLWRQQMASSVGHATVSIAKNRQGPTGGTRLRFQDRTTWFRDESEPEDSPAWIDTL